MAYQLRERDYLTLEDMLKATMRVEANLIEKRARMRSEKRVTYKDDTTPAPSSSDTKLDSIVRKMERMMEKLILNERTPPGKIKPIFKTGIEIKILEANLL